MLALRRAMRQHQGIPPGQPKIPMWQLVGGEVAHLARLVADPRRGAAALVAAALVVAALSPATPGPVAHPLLLFVLAIVSAVLGAWLGVWLPRQATARGVGASGWRGAAIGVVAVLIAGAALATVVWLLATVVSSLS